MSVSKHRDRVIDLRAKLANAGFQFICAPDDYNFDKLLFFDTECHLNLAGVIMRSEKFAKCFNTEVLSSSSSGFTG